MKLKTTLIEKTEKFVLDLFKNKLPSTFLYHNFVHTQRVVKSTKELISNTEIDVKQQEALLLAAWLHDTGYTITFEGHEEESVIIARKFLMEHQADKEIIEDVKRCILATKFNTEPRDVLEEIIKDADTSHFGKDYFEDTSKLLRQELRLQHIKEYSDKEWINENIKFFTQKHRYYTPFAIASWQEQKDKNLLSLLEKSKKMK